MNKKNEQLGAAAPTEIPAQAGTEHAEAAQPKCKKCGGNGVADDGEIDCYPNGEPYMCGPVKCVKDCPDCSVTGDTQAALSYEHDFAKLMMYPQEWDIAAYPTLESAMWEAISCAQIASAADHERDIELHAASQQPAAAPAEQAQGQSAQAKRYIPPRDEALCNDGMEPDWAGCAQAEAQQGDGELPPLNEHDQSVMEDIKAYADDRSERSTFWKRATAIAALRIIGDLRTAIAQRAGSAKPSEQAGAQGKPAAGGDAASQDVSELERLAASFAQWRLCMSYNDSYFGEPAGELKRIAREINRLLPIKPKQSTSSGTIEALIEDNKRLHNEVTGQREKLSAEMHAAYKVGFRDGRRSTLKIEGDSEATQASQPAGAEPIAWAALTDEGTARIWFGELKPAAQHWATFNCHELTPLYTAPPAAVQSDSKNYSALFTRIDEALENYVRHGSICEFEGQPMIYASTLLEIANLLGEVAPNQQSDSERDAARYRFLRNGHWHNHTHPEIKEHLITHVNRDALDAAIDAAMAAQQSEKGGA